MPSPLSSYGHLMSVYLKPLRMRILLLAVLLFSGIGLQLINPQIIRYFIDTAQSGGTVQTLTEAAGLYLGIALITQFFSVGATYLSSDIGWLATNRMRADLVDHCLHLDMPFHNTHTPGELIERVDGDVGVLRNFFSDFAVQLLGNLLLLLGILCFLFLEDWRIGSLFTAFVMITFLILNRVRGTATAYWHDSRQASAELYGFLEERLSGLDDVRANGAVPYVLQEFARKARSFFFKNRRASFRAGLVSDITPAFMTIGYLMAFGIGIYFYRADAMTIGTVYILVHYVQMIKWPVFMIRHQVDDLQRATAGIERLATLFQLQPEIQDGSDAELEQHMETGIEVACEAVSFRYGDGPQVLHDVSFEVKPGRILGVLGRTGSGKTTLTRLLFRLYDPESGIIRLSGRDIRRARLPDLRHRIGMVTQDVQLFHASLRDNLTFFDPQITDDAIMAAIQTLGLSDWFSQRAVGLDTELSTGGSGLSAGEAQLLAFTRVFLRDPALIILDEASSRLDPATEKRLEQAMDHLLNRRTGIIIAHRLRTIHRADDIMILEDGRVVEFGERERLARDPDSRFHRLLRTGLEEVSV